MSLFKTRTFWRTNCGHQNDECFDQNSLHLTKLNSDSDYIVTASHSGILRIFKPSSDLSENNILSDYKPTDLLLEKIFDGPILQIASGRLVSGTIKVQLAVLQSKSFSVYSLICKEGATDHGTQNILQLLYEHKLRRSSSNFLIGPFGGTQNRDFICVQSLDGLIAFFEQESFAFCCYLPDFLLPSSLAYVKKSDSFVTCNSNWRVISYKYKLLSEAGEKSASENNSDRKIRNDWEYNLGEPILDIEVVDGQSSTKENNNSIVIILGERNLHCLNDTGQIMYMKKLDYSPICYANYITNDKIMSLVVSETSTLLVYQNTTVKWSAQLPFVPVSIKRAFLKNIHGVVVLLSDEGQLECCYLGTEPSLFVAPPLNNQDLDFEQVGIELASLNKIIKNSYKSDIKMTNASTKRELTINILVNPHLEACIYETNIKTALNNQMCAVSIDVLPQAPFDEVQISFFVNPPLKVEPQAKFFANLSERTALECHVFLDEPTEIPSLNLQVVATFISNVGIPRNIAKSALLPLKLVAETCAPHKENEHKITLSINQSPAVGLSNLFPEFIGENSFTSSSNAIAFKNTTDAGHPVTILLAKSSERYRLQSDCFASLNLLTEQLISRLRKYYFTSSQPEFSIACNGSLPINETFLYVDNHFSARLEYNRLQNELSQLSTQFRLVQKRLISKFKAKNPTPLSNLKILLDDTHTDLTNVADKLQETTANLTRSQIELSCALSLIVNLLKLMDIDRNLASILESTYCTTIYDLDGQNWEDTIDAALCYLLRTVLAKSDKDKLRAAHTSFEEIKEICKVEKHLAQVLERVQKRGEGALVHLENMHLDQNDEQREELTMRTSSSGGNDETTLIGRELGESSLRLLSAKKGLLDKRRHKLQ